MSAPAPAAPANAPASTGFLSGLFGAKKPANSTAPAPAVGGRRGRSRKHRSRKHSSRKDHSRKDRKDRSRSRRNRSRKDRK